MIELEQVIRHATMANFDNELSSIVVIMTCKNKEPELHMAISSDDLYNINAATDMFKIELLKLMTARAQQKKDRE